MHTLSLFKFGVKIAVSSILIFLILRSVGINKISAELATVKPGYLGLVLLLVIPLMILRAIRWNTAIEVFKAKIDLATSIKYTLISTAFSLVTPAKIGEFIKMKYLTNKTGIRYLKSFLSVVLDKGFDVLAMILLALLGLQFIPEFAGLRAIFFSLFVGYIICLIFVFATFNWVTRNIVRIIPKKYKDSYKRMHLTRTMYAKSLLLSIFIWVTLSIQGFLILKALGISTSLVLTISVLPLMAFSTLVPFSLGGIGIRELIAISFLLVVGISAEKAAVFSLLYTSLISGIPAILGVWYYLIYKKTEMNTKPTPNTKKAV